MAQYQASLGQVGMIKQTAQGSPATPLAAAGPTRWQRLRSSSMGPDRSLLIPDPEIAGAGQRDVPKVYLGPTVFSGEHEMYVRQESLPLWLAGAFGTTNAPTQPGGAITPTALTGYQHVIQTADVLPWFTVQEQIGNGFDVLQYNDAQVNTFHLECGADGYFMAKAGLIALAGTAGNTAVASPTFDNTPLIVGSKVVVTIGGTYSTATNAMTGGTAFPAQSFSFDLSNAIESNHFVLGSLFPDAFTPKRREITGNLALRPQTNSYFRQAVFGTSGTQTSITGLTVVTNLNISATSYEIINGATSQVYNLTLNMGEVILAPHKLTASHDSVLEETFDFRVVKVAGAFSVTADVTNGVSLQY